MASALGTLGPRKRGNTPTAVGLLGGKVGAVVFPGVKPAVSSHVGPGRFWHGDCLLSNGQIVILGPARPERIAELLLSRALILGLGFIVVIVPGL